MTWVQTFTGRSFDLAHPRAEDVRAADLAHALAYSCRFGGHTRAHYSVAQHSILVAALVWHRTGDEWARLVALLHDAHEAYTGDIKQPVKALLEDFAGRSIVRMLEAPIDAAIRAWAGVNPVVPLELVGQVKRADAEILLWERDRFLGASPKPWILDGQVAELREADFGVEPGSALLEAWRPEIAERAFAVALGWCAAGIESSVERVPAWLFYELTAGIQLRRAAQSATAGGGGHQ